MRIKCRVSNTPLLLGDMQMLPKTLSAAVVAGLINLTNDARKELAEAGFIDPHTNYRTDFEK